MGNRQIQLEGYTLLKNLDESKYYIVLSKTHELH